MKIQDTFSDMSRNISNQTTQFAHYSLVRLNLKYMELPFHYGGRFNSLFRNSKLTRKFLMGFCVNNRNIVFWRKQFRETKIGLFWKKKFENLKIFKLSFYVFQRVENIVLKKLITRTSTILVICDLIKIQLVLARTTYPRQIKDYYSSAWSTWEKVFKDKYPGLESIASR